MTSGLDPDVIEVLVRMKGGREFRSEATASAAGVDKITRSTKASEYASERATLKLGKFRTSIGILGRSALAVAGVAGVAGLVEAVHLSVDAFKEHDVVANQTAAVLHSTGAAAGISAKGIEDQAHALGQLSGMNTEQIQQGENMLLTFRNVRNEMGKGNDIFNQGTQAALDMAAAFTASGKQMSVSQAALQLGKALNDPAKGMLRLQRLGVNFSQSQIDQVKTYDALGDRLSAQKVILGELNKEFGGSAAAYGKTLPGAIGRAENALRDLGITVGEAVAPAIADGAGAVAKFVTQMEEGDGAGGKFVTVLKDAGGILKDTLGPPLHFVVTNMDTLAPLVAAAASAWVGYKVGVAGAAAAQIVFNSAGTIGMVVSLAASVTSLADAEYLAAAAADALGLSVAGLATGGLALVAAALVLAYIKVGWFHNAVDAVWHFIQTNWSLIGTAILFGLTGPVGAGVFYAITHLGQLVDFVSGMGGKIEGAASGMWDGIAHAFRASVNWVIGAWDSLHFAIGGWHIKGPFGVGVTIPRVAVGVPQIPMLASGGDVAAAGAAIVGERGPELLQLGAGARVTPLAREHRVRQPIQLIVDGAVLAQIMVNEALTAEARQ